MNRLTDSEYAEMAKDYEENPVTADEVLGVTVETAGWRSRAQEAEAALERVKAEVGELRWMPDCSCADRVLAALHGVPLQPPTTQGDHT